MLICYYRSEDKSARSGKFNKRHETIIDHFITDLLRSQNMDISLNAKTVIESKKANESKGTIQEKATILKFESASSERVHLRWMLPRDIAEVSVIERSCFEFSWTEEEFAKCLKQRNCVGMVAEKGGDIIGFMIYELTRNRINLLNIGIHPGVRNRSVGRQLVEKLIGKLTGERRNRISCEIREKNLAAQLFFKSLGFRAVSILRNFYEETREDAYVMQYRVSESRRRAA